MRRLPSPDDVFPHVYETCVQGKHEPTKTRLRAISNAAFQMEANYWQLAVNGRLHQLPKLANQVALQNSKEELSKLYDERMARNPSPGRAVYDRLLAAGLPRCPYCNHNRPRQLDHVLPKEAEGYPELSLAPINLVPSCADCNFLKRTHAPNAYVNEFFHPYFESPEGLVWLVASLDFSPTDELTVLFDTARFEGYEPFSQRVNFQFSKLELGVLYAAQAATELGNLRFGLEQLLAASDTAAVQEKLFDDYSSYNAFDPNSWKSAMYRTLYQSDRFCSLDWTL